MSALPVEPSTHVTQAVIAVTEPGRFKRAAVWVWRFAIGAFLIQTFVGGFVAFGWTARAMRRWTLKRWWAKAEVQDKYRSFAAEFDRNAVSPPAWILGQPIAAPKGERKFRHYVSRAFGGLWANVRYGAVVYLPTAAMVIPAQVLWWFGWYAGWDNSFNKGYEQAQVGVSIALLGMLVFSVVMLYAPMAQARTALTGDWRSFFDFGLNRKLVRSSWPSMLLLAVAYAIAAIPVVFFTVFIIGLPNAVDGFTEFSKQEVLEFLNGYYFWAGALVFFCFLLVHRLGARIYADAVLRGIGSGTIDPMDLSDAEVHALRKLNHIQEASTEERGRIVRLMAAAAKPMYRIPCIIGCFIIWFMVAFGVNVGSFFNYQGASGWLNHPLIELPTIRYIPGHLKSNAETYPFAK